MIVLSTLSLAAGWAWLLLHDISGFRWAGEIPVWPVALLLVIAAAAALLFRGNQRSSSGLWVAIGLTALAFVFFHLWPSSTGTTRRGWWRDSSHRIAAALRAVGDEVAGLEEVSVEIAERVRTFMAGSNADALRADPTEAFALLDSIAQSVSAGKALTPGTAIGLQLFAPGAGR